MSNTLKRTLEQLTENDALTAFENARAEAALDNVRYIDTSAFKTYKMAINEIRRMVIEDNFNMTIPVLQFIYAENKVRRQ